MDAACQAFWAKGYEATTTQDLCEATGLGRSSIYNTFTSKDHVFLRTLAHYIETMTARQFAVLDEEGSAGLERIQALFAMLLEGEMENRDPGRASGCFTVNTLTEPVSADDPEVARLLAKDLERRLDSSPPTTCRASPSSGRPSRWTWPPVNTATRSPTSARCCAPAPWTASKRMRPGAAASPSGCGPRPSRKPRVWSSPGTARPTHTPMRRRPYRTCGTSNGSTTPSASSAASSRERGLRTEGRSAPARVTAPRLGLTLREKRAEK